MKKARTKTTIMDNRTHGQNYCFSSRINETAGNTVAHNMILKNFFLHTVQIYFCYHVLLWYDHDITRHMQLCQYSIIHEFIETYF